MSYNLKLNLVFWFELEIKYTQNDLKEKISIFEIPNSKIVMIFSIARGFNHGKQIVIMNYAPTVETVGNV